MATSPQKTALVTGCTPGGIGNALARELHSRGFFVFATARTLEKITDLKGLGIECLCLTVDDTESVKACHKKAVQILDGRGLDFLINNAGKTIVRPSIELNIPEAKDLFATNILGPMLLTQTFSPQLLHAKGTIVNIGSVAGHIPLPFNAVYSATKAALYAYSACMRLELAPFGVHVVYVQTGNVRTHIMRQGTRLEEGSKFLAVEDGFLERQRIAATTGMETGVFAGRLVGRLVRGGVGDVVWEGESAGWCWVGGWLEGWLPFSMWKLFFWWGYGMWRLGE
ncbi:hypothetical protein HYFRA_00000957 [Hymenoscyphus fraxineus]|uniref:NAD(P)-binding protein n=1 Tax=Hymenoscyphus fraxineus TaxID=746836 RepID=A0A9N9KUF3_9HELO|nr:hypothetical protein HYFRA_00000957 [Hymenoscyphus fraxineus]